MQRPRKIVVIMNELLHVMVYTKASDACQCVRPSYGQLPIPDVRAFEGDFKKSALELHGGEINAALVSLRVGSPRVAEPPPLNGALAREGAASGKLLGNRDAELRYIERRVVSGVIKCLKK
jgi:hypothetical protein